MNWIDSLTFEEFLQLHELKKIGRNEATNIGD
jgi:hypothetical protein